MSASEAFDFPLTEVSVPGTGHSIQVGAALTNHGRKLIIRVRSPLPPVMAVEYEATNEAPAVAAVPVPGQRGYTQEHWEDIAARYRQARRDTPKTAIRTVALAVGRSEGTVSRWLARCREMGLLGPD